MDTRNSRLACYPDTAAQGTSSQRYHRDFCEIVCRYARVGEAQREQFEQFTKQYFLNRPNLAMVFLLIDSTVTPQKVGRKGLEETGKLPLLIYSLQIDLEYAAWLTDNSVPFCIVFTKTDKRKKGVPKKESNMIEFKREMLKVGHVCCRSNSFIP
jgi:GTP-binding protein EngB required for normal cell division